MATTSQLPTLGVGAGVVEGVGSAARLGQSGLAAAADAASAYGGLTAPPSTRASTRFPGSIDTAVDGTSAPGPIGGLERPMPEPRPTGVIPAMLSTVADTSNAIGGAVQRVLPPRASQSLTPEWFIFNAGKMVPQMAASLGLTAAGTAIAGPAGGVAAASLPTFALEGGQQAEQLYQAGVAQGKPEHEALADAFVPSVATGLVNAGLEQGGVEKLIRTGVIKQGILRYLGEVGVSAASEGLQEMAQGEVQRSIAGAATGDGYDPFSAEANAQRVQEGILGAAMGGGASAIVQAPGIRGEPAKPTLRRGPAITVETGPDGRPIVRRKLGLSNQGEESTRWSDGLTLEDQASAEEASPSDLPGNRAELRRGPAVVSPEALGTEPSPDQDARGSVPLLEDEGAARTSSIPQAPGTEEALDSAAQSARRRPGAPANPTLGTPDASALRTSSSPTVDPSDSDQLQLQIDEETDRLVASGMTFDEASNAPQVMALYARRDEIDSREYSTSYAAIEKDSDLPPAELQPALNEIRIPPPSSSTAVAIAGDTVRRWDVATTDNISKLYRHFARGESGYVNVFVGGDPNRPGVEFQSEHPLNADALRKTESVYNTVARALGQPEISLASQIKQLEPPKPRLRRGPAAKDGDIVEGAPSRPLGGIAGVPESEISREPTPAGQYRAPKLPREDTTFRTESTAATERDAETTRKTLRSGKMSDPSISVHQAIRRLHRALGMQDPNIGGNRSKLRHFAGYYRPGKQSITLKRADDIQTAAHEVGHAIHEMLFPGVGRARKKSLPAHWNGELAPMGKALYGTKKPNSGYPAEGWAEFVRMLVTDKAAAKKAAPTVYAEVTDGLSRKYPDVLAGLDRANADFQQLQAQSPIRTFISSGVREPETLRSRIDGFRAAWFDRFQRAITLKEDLGVEFSPDQDPEFAIRRQSGVQRAHMDAIVHKGIWDLADPTMKPTGPSLSSALEPVRDKIEAWEDYMVARRIEEKRGQGYEVATPISAAEVQAAISAGKADPAVLKAEAEFRKVEHWLVNEYAVKMGLLTPEAAKAIADKNLAYITFAETHENLDATQRGKSGKGFHGAYSGFSRFNPGEGRPIQDPLGAFLGSLHGITSRATKNAAARRIFGLWDADIPGIGRWIEKVDAPMKATRVTSEQISKAVNPALKGLTEEQKAAVVEAIEAMDSTTFWGMGGKLDEKNNQVAVRDKGEVRYYRVRDKHLMKMLSEANASEQLDPWAQMLTFAPAVLRMGATALNPSFIVPNFFRDTLQALTMTEAKWRELPAATARRLKGMKSAFQAGDVERMFQAGGADMGDLFRHWVDGKTGKPRLQDIFERKGFVRELRSGRALNAAKQLNPLRLIGRLNQTFERMTRFGEFEAMRKGRTNSDAIAAAAQAASEVTLDFTRGGYLAKKFNKGFPFLNVTLVGTDKLIRFVIPPGVLSGVKRELLVGRPLGAAKELTPSVVNLMKIAFVMGAPSLLAMAMNKDDEEYWKIDPRLRDRYWWFPYARDAGGTRWLRLPKPPGIGLFAVAMERTAAAMFGIDPVTGERGINKPFKGFSDAVADLLPSINPGALLPLWEVYSNKSFFTKKPIVSRGDQELPDYLQGDDYASDTARALGRLFDYPPAKIDYLIRGFTGGAGKDVALFGVDPIIRATGLIPERPRARDDSLERMPVLRSFMANSSKIQHEVINEFYDAYDEANRYHRGVKAVGEEEQEAYVARHKAALDRYPTLNRAFTKITKLRAQRRDAMRSKQLTGDERMRIVRDIDQAIVDEARGALR